MPSFWLMRVAAIGSLAMLVVLSGLLLQLSWQRLRPTPVAVAAPTRIVVTLPPTVTPTAPPNAAAWFHIVPEPLASPTPEPTAEPPPTASPTPEPTLTPSPTIVPLRAAASFRPAGSFLHNIRVALEANNGALQRVVVPPGETFSFVAALGPQPLRLPWRDVFVQSDGPALPEFYRTLPITNVVPLPPGMQQTVAPAPPEAAPAAPSPAPPLEPPPPTAIPSPTAEPLRVLGGGVCDLASRYVVAARPLLPAQAFAFKRHTGGVPGVADRDAVAIWFEGSAYDLDLRITNLTDRWLVFETVLDASGVTVTATLGGPPDS